MKIDFYVSVIDNYGDMGFALNMADTLFFYCKNLKIRFFSDDKKLYKIMTKKLLGASCIEYIDISEITKRIPEMIIFNFFDRKLPEQFLSKFQFDIRIWNFSYFLLHRQSGIYNPSIQSMHKKKVYLGKNRNIEVSYFIISLLEGTGGVIINPVSEQLKKTKSISLSAREMFFKKHAIQFNRIWENKKWVSLFIYPETLGRLSQSGFFRDDKKIFFLFGKTKNIEISENIICMPFLSLNDYAYFLSLCDLNVVRGENSLVDAILAEKPFLWDIYKEFNNSHTEKLHDFISFLSGFHFTEGYFQKLQELNSMDILSLGHVGETDEDIKNFKNLSLYVKNECNIYEKIKKDLL